MKRTRAAYWRKFKEVAIDTKIAKELPYEIIELLAPVGVPVRWKEKVTRKQGKVWREYPGLIEYKPGEVLHREWRSASQWEIEEWKDLPEKKLKELGVFRKDKEFSIQIVEKIKDLPAAIRQRGRHVPARKIGRIRKKFTLTGDAQLLADYARRLSHLLEDFLKNFKPSPQLMEKASVEFAQIPLFLERSRTSLKKGALAEIKLALQGRFWEIPARTSEAITNLLNQRVKDYEIAMKSIELAEKWRDLMAEIERRFRNCYNRLGQLGEKLQGLLATGEAIQPKDLLPIANEAYGIWKHLTEKVPNFNPYYQRLQEPEFQRLSRIVLHAEKGKAETVFNDLMEAAAKLEAIAIGEKPTRVEIRRQKERFSMGPSKE